MSVFGGLSGTARQIVSMVTIKTETKGDNALKNLFTRLGSIRERLVSLGVTTIFVDRLVQSLNRAWSALNETMGFTRASQQAAQYDRISQALGIQVEQVQALDKVMVRYGANINDVVDVLQTMEEKFVSWSQGSKSAAQMFEGTGVTLAGVKDLDTMERFFAVAKGLSQLDPNRRAGILSQMFGDDAARKIGPLIASGLPNLIKQMREAMDLGAVMSKKQIGTVEAVRISMERLKMVVEGLQNNLTAMFSPAITKAADELTRFLGRISRWVRDNGESWGVRLTKWVGDALDNIRKIGEYIDKYVMPLEDFVVRMAQGLAGVGVILAVIFAGPLIAQMLVLLGAATAFAIALDDIFEYMRGGRSAFGSFLEDSAVFQWLLSILENGLEQSKELLGEVWSLVLEVISSPLFMAFLGGIGIVLDMVIVGLRGIVAVLRVLWWFLERIVELAMSMGFVALAEGLGGLGMLNTPATTRAKGWSLLSESVDKAQAPLGPFQAQDRTKGLFGALMGPTFNQMMYSPENRAIARPNVTNNVTIQSQDPDKTMQAALESSQRQAESSLEDE